MKIETKVFKSSTGNAADIIKNGGLVGVPTETVYGLAGNGLDEKAVEQIYEIKGRPAVKPLSLMVPGAEAIAQYTESAPEDAYVLAEKFWPGPLTIVLKAKEFIPAIVLAGGKTVGLRCPDNEYTLKLLREAGVPFAAPSANISGEESPKNAEAVLKYFDGKIDAVIDGGECTIGTESTLIEMSALPYRILRQGALKREQIADALREKMTVVGITGGTGVGKSTALEYIKEKGGLIIDCDRLYHRLLDTCEEMNAEIQKRFPEAYSSGALERKKLGSIVFADGEALNELNAITHRYVRSAVKELLREHALNGGKLAAVDAVELISSGCGEECTVTVAVTATEEVRAMRIIERDNISPEYAMMRIKAQRSDEYYKQSCTYCIENNGSREEFLKEFRSKLDL